MEQSIKVNDRVAYTPEFLRSVGEYTGPMPFARGRVLRLDRLTSDLTLASILWEEDHFGQLPDRVNVHNLTTKGFA